MVSAGRLRERGSSAGILVRMGHPRRALITLLSLLVVGLSQGLAGKRDRMLLVIAVWLALAFGMLTRVALIAALAAVVWIVLAAVDGYRQLGRIERVHRPLGVLAFVLATIGGGSMSMAMGSYKVPSSSSYPTLLIGDHILVNKLASPQRGDTVVFRWPCNPQRNYIKRLIGMPGDTIEVRCARVYINGAELPRRLVARLETYPDVEHRAEASRYRETAGEHTYDVLQDPRQPDWDAGTRMEDHLAIQRCEGQFDFDGGEEVLGTIAPVAVPGSEQNACSQRYAFVVPAGTYFMLGDHRTNSNDSRAWGVVPSGHVIGVVSSIYWPPGRAGSVP
jgi:signal peptidase I